MNPIRRRLADACYWISDKFEDLGNWIAGIARRLAGRW